MNGWVLALALLLFGLLQRFILVRFGMKGLSYQRRFSRPAAFEGEDAELIEVIRNDRPLFVPWLRAESRISPYLRFGRQDNLSVRGDRYHRSIFTLRPFQQITRRHKVHLAHRGAFDAGNVSLTVGDLLGIGGEGKELYTPARILVYPRLLREEDLPLPVSRLQGDLIVRRHLVSDPFLVNGIRDYQSGDAVKDIHWPATARMGSLQVKTHDYTADPRVMVLINSQKTEDQWGDLMDYEMARIEYAISLAAGLCLRALNQGCEAGFAANIPLDEEETFAYFTPSREAGRDTALLRALACLRIRRVCSFPTFLEQLPPLSGVDYVILSCYDSPTLRRHMEAMGRLGNSVTLHIVPEEVPDA